MFEESDREYEDETPARKGKSSNQRWKTTNNSKTRTQGLG